MQRLTIFYFALSLCFTFLSTTRAERVGLTVDGIHSMSKQLKSMADRQASMYGNGDTQMLTVFAKPEKDWKLSWNVSRWYGVFFEICSQVADYAAGHESTS